MNQKFLLIAFVISIFLFSGCANVPPSQLGSFEEDIQEPRAEQKTKASITVVGEETTASGPETLEPPEESTINFLDPSTP